MQIQLETQPYASLQADALVTYIFDKETKFEGVLADIDRAMNGRLARSSRAAKSPESRSKLALVHFPEGLAAQRLLLIGAGKPEKFNVSDLRKIAGTALRQMKSRA